MKRSLTLLIAAALLSGCVRDPNPYEPGETYSDAAINAALTASHGPRITALGVREIAARATLDEGWRRGGSFFSPVCTDDDNGDNDCYEVTFVAQYAAGTDYTYVQDDFVPIATAAEVAGAVAGAPAGPPHMSWYELNDVQVLVGEQGVQFKMPIEWRSQYSRDEARTRVAAALDQLLRPLEREATWSTPATGAFGSAAAAR